MFILKPHSGVPIYRQLLEQIRRMATSGQLAPGTELPSIRDLALRHAINPMTVSKVYSLLETTIDKCEDVANVIERIVVKHA